MHTDNAMHITYCSEVFTMHCRSPLTIALCYAKIYITVDDITQDAQDNSKSKQIRKELKPLLYRWSGDDKQGRNRAMPHIKSYCRYRCASDNTVQIAWFLLTSANMSTSAWGVVQPDGQLCVRTYELG
jgi:Tyrosyl-DNA phosphodiesterase